jgi:SnoaL-like domain
LPREFPGTTFYFLPADMVTQVLNFGVPAPIDIQLEGADIDGNRKVADTIMDELRHVPGLTDPRIQQAFDYPTLMSLVLEAFDTLFNQRDYETAERFWSPNYIQHSAHIEPGREGLFNLIKSMPSTLRYESGTIVADGDFVMVHGRFSGFGQPAKLDRSGHRANRKWSFGRTLGRD